MRETMPHQPDETLRFGYRLALEIEHRGWSRSDFARELDVDPAQVTRWLNDKQEPSLRTLFAMALVFARHDHDPIYRKDPPLEKVARWMDRLFRWYAEANGLPETPATVLTELVDASPEVIQVIEALAAIPPDALAAVAQQAERLQSHRQQRDESQ